MLLRDHPLMSCYGIPSWPPTWMLLKGPGATRLTGEFGILKGIRANDLPSTRRCFLYMQHEESSYLGCIFIANVTFFGQIVKIFQDCSIDRSYHRRAAFVLPDCNTKSLVDGSSRRGLNVKAVRQSSLCTM